MEHQNKTLSEINDKLKSLKNESNNDENEIVEKNQENLTENESEEFPEITQSEGEKIIYNHKGKGVIIRRMVDSDKKILMKYATLTNNLGNVVVQKFCFKCKYE